MNLPGRAADMTKAKQYMLDKQTSYKLSHYTKYNISDVFSDIHILSKEHEERILEQLRADIDILRTPFPSFADVPVTRSYSWLDDNEERFFKNTPNEVLVKMVYMTETGFICCLEYCMDGEMILVGHSTGLVQLKPNNSYKWVETNYDMFLKDTPNEVLHNRWFYSEMGFMMALEFSPDGSHIVTGHSNGMIQVRHGATGAVVCTLRNIQFPPKPIYAIHYSKTEERVCYASSADGNIYRIEIPNILPPLEDPPQYCIKADPALECLTMQFYGAPGTLSYATPFITQRAAALSFGLTSDEAKVVVGYDDTSIRVYDKEERTVITSYKVHKLRVQLIPTKLQRCHAGQVCAIKCYDNDPHMFASAAWDNTLRIWDVRCNVGCVMTFNGVQVASDSIDVNRDQCIVGSWQPSEALTVYDLKAKKRLTIMRVQNRRPDVDGEYIYACRYWRSKSFNRKGKYAIIGGSGTQCVEVINLHNRYISCSYPAEGTVLAITSHQERIAFGGTAPVFNIVSFHDPKHERYNDTDPLVEGEVWAREPGEYFQTEPKKSKEASVTAESESMADSGSNRSSIDLGG